MNLRHTYHPALAAGLGGGIYVGSYKRMVVEKAARDIWLMAKYARIAAIEQQQTLQLEFDRVNRRCWVSTESNGSTLESTIVRNGFCRPLELPAGVDFVGLSVGLPQSSAETGEEEISRVVFHPNGTADTAAIAVGDGKTLYGITINGATGGASLGVGEAALAVADLSVDLESK